MGVRQQLTELRNRVDGQAFEVWEEADGTNTGKMGSADIVKSEEPIQFSYGVAAPNDGDGKPDGSIYFQV